jgi:hypothetical protein
MECFAMATERTTGSKERGTNLDNDSERDENPDPITGEHGSHPVGAGIGTAVGGAAAGAAAGAVAGPVGAAVGIVAGGIAGGLAGKEIAERIDPTVEEHHWRNVYPTRDYYDENVDYNQIGPAYQYGWESRAKYHDRSWDEAERDLARDWNTQRGKSSLDWPRARPATRDAWERVDVIAVEEVDDDLGRCSAENPTEPRQQTPRTPK